MFPFTQSHILIQSIDLHEKYYLNINNKNRNQQLQKDYNNRCNFLCL